MPEEDKVSELITKLKEDPKLRKAVGNYVDKWEEGDKSKGDQMADNYGESY